jgi:subtilisin-like proprotein convertase family protein
MFMTGEDEMVLTSHRILPSSLQGQWRLSVSELIQEDLCGFHPGELLSKTANFFFF